MTEKNFEGTLGRLVGLKAIRKSVGEPSSEEIGKMRGEFPKVKSVCENAIAISKDIILTSFSQNRTNFSIPGFCATVLVKQIRDRLLVKAEEIINEIDINEKNVEDFRYIFDLAFGFGLPLNRVLAAEGELSDGGEESRLRILAYQSENYGIPVTEEVDTYLFMKKFDSDALKLLIKDKSGLELIDDLINKIKSNSSVEDMGITDGMSKEYVIAGAELARDIYRQLCQMIDPSVPPEQKK